MNEIELKYFIDEPCEELENKILNCKDYNEIYQQYLLINNEHEIRIREEIYNNDDVQHYLSHKIKINNIIRKEYNIKISKNQFYSLNDLSIAWIHKKRYIIFHNDYKIMIDKFLNIDLYLVEVEFDNVYDAFEFSPPTFLRCSDDNIYDVTELIEAYNSHIFSHNIDKNYFKNKLNIRND